MRDFAKDGEWEYAVEMARLVAPDGTLYVVEEAPRVPDAIRGDPMFRNKVVRVLRRRPGESSLTPLPTRRHPLSTCRLFARGAWPPETLTAVRLVRGTIELEWDCEDLNAARWCDRLGAWISRRVSWTCDLPVMHAADRARGEAKALRAIENVYIARGLIPPRTDAEQAGARESRPDGPNRRNPEDAG